MSKKTLNFILCNERTGSSMLTAMLNTSDHVLSPSEEPFLLYFHGKYGHITKWTNDQLNDFVDDFFLLHDKNISVYFDKKAIVKARLSSIKKEATYLDICKHIYMNFYPAKNKDKVGHIVDKQIKYVYHWEKLIRLVPEAKFILLIRNPLDNLASWRKRNLGRSSGAMYLADEWNDINKILLDFSLKHPSKTHIVKYEDLVSEPTSTLQKICDFLLIPYNEDMINFSESFQELARSTSDKDPQFSDKLKDFHSGLYQEVNTKNIDSYRTYFNQKEIDIICTHCSSVAQAFNYPLPEHSKRRPLFGFVSVFKSRLSRRYLLRFYFKLPFSWKKGIRKLRSKKVSA